MKTYPFALLAAATSAGSAVAGLGTLPAVATPKEPVVQPDLGNDVGVAEGDDYVTIEQLNPDGTPVLGSVPEHFNAAGQRVEVLSDGTLRPIAAPGDSGEGGTPSASGCARLTVSNEAETYLGFTAFWYRIYTDWCWNRADRTVDINRTDQYFTDVDPNYYYRELVSHVEYKYAYVSGYNKSGHWHERQSRWENCVVEYGCLGTLYPRNIGRVHHDGTWTWRTDD